MRQNSSKLLYIDIETYCEADLRKCGVYAYTQHPAFDIMLIAYAFNAGPVKVVDTQDEGIPDNLICALEDSNITKVAHNAAFEMQCFREYDIKIDEADWVCTMAMANRQSLPAGLSQLAEALKLDIQKMSIGTSLISYFSKGVPRRTKYTSEEALDKWEVFKEYCIRDVETARAVYNALAAEDQGLALEDELYRLDCRINSKGVLVDTAFVSAARRLADIEVSSSLEKLKRLTELDNPNSVLQFKKYLKEAHGLEVDILSKDVVQELYDTTKNGDLKEILRLRLLSSKASLKKYDAIARATCRDNKIRGMLQYYGASRTGRWAGRLVQLHNLKRNSIPDIGLARDLVLAGDAEGLKLAYGLDVTEIFGQLIRTALVPCNDYFIVSDFSAIEARVLAWLAGETWKLKVFADGGDIYKMSYSKAFKVPIQDVTKDMRQIGKVMELALGYGGGIGAMQQFGAEKLGMDNLALQSSVLAWRRANRYITNFWYELEVACIDAIAESAVTQVSCLKVYMRKGKLRIMLPSGRELTYQNVRLTQNRFGGCAVSYTDYRAKHVKSDTYGGKLAENVTQATARDLLAEAMLRLDASGFDIVAHVHDEVIIDGGDKDEVSRIMCQMPAWADGLAVAAESYTCPYYYKD